MVTEARETGSLIGSDKVEGTAVYGADNQKIGSIERVMIDKMSGKLSRPPTSLAAVITACVISSQRGDPQPSAERASHGRSFRHRPSAVAHGL
jgi:PRC-barrel domain